jgi:hypothetical protein
MAVSDHDLPQAWVARVPSPAGTKVSAVLVPRPMGFLAVKLLVDGHPLVGRAVGFFECDDDENKGAAIGQPITSDDDGVARLPRLVPVGTYLCEVEDQLATIVTTVNKLRAAYPLFLPIGSEAIDGGAVLATRKEGE